MNIIIINVPPPDATESLEVWGQRHGRTAREVMFMIRNENLPFIQFKDGPRIPVYEAAEWFRQRTCNKVFERVENKIN